MARFAWMLAPLLLVGCTVPGPNDRPTTRTLDLPKGTEVQMVLLDRLESGGSEVGSTARLVVEKPVLAEDGTPLIEAGTLVTATVVRSRGSSAAAAVINQPARLEVTFGPVPTRDGGQAALAADPQDPAKPYEFSLSNTGAELSSDRLAELWDDPEARAALERLADAVGKDGAEALEDTTNREDLARVARTLGLEDASRLAGNPETRSALRGEELDKLSAEDLLLLVSGMRELGALARTVDGRLRGIFKGRTIRAEVGTPVTVSIAEDTTVVVSEEP